MAFDCRERKRPLLYSDLFKSQRNMAAEKEQQSVAKSKLESPSSSSSSNQFSLSCDSSSSGFSTPLYSDLGSSEGEDGEFIAELTSQMAECMLQEEEENTVQNNVGVDFEAIDPMNGSKHRSFADSVAINSLKAGLSSSPVRVDDLTQPIPVMKKVHELKNRPPANQQAPVCRGRRIAQPQKQRQQKTEHFRWGSGHGRDGHSGAGMQAVFLDGSGSRSGSTGTGVFLPRVSSHPNELKKKSGCPTVLMPTRVLQLLELHFNQVQGSTATSPRDGSLNYSCPKDESSISEGLRNVGQPQLENSPANYEEMQLPHEWTY